MGNADGNAHSFRRWLAAAALAGLPLIGGPALAENVSRSEFQAFRDLATGATKHTVTMSSNGVPLVTRGVPGAPSNTKVGNMNFGHGANEFPKASANVDIPSPITGKALPATATQSFSKASQAAALAKFAMKLAVPITTGMALYDLLVDLKLVSSWHEAEKTNSFQEEITDQNCPLKNLSQAVVDQSCKDVTSNPQATGTLQYRVFNNRCQWSVKCSNGYQFSWEDLGAPSNSIRYEDRDEGQIAALIAQRSGWPSAFTAADRAMADAMNSGEVIQLEPVDAAKITSTQTKVVSDPKTSTLSDGTTKTETTTCEWVQGIPPGPLEWRCWTNSTTVTPQKTTLETVTKTNPDGSTSTETISKTTPSTTTTGTTTAAASELDEKLCPDGSRRLVCSELDTPTAVEVPKLTKELTYAPDASFNFGGGSCPAPFSWNDSLGSHSLDLTQYCGVLSSVVRPIIIALALLAGVFIILPRET